MKSIIISDSFKGTLSSKEISLLFEKAYLNIFPKSTLIKKLVADGGEGTIDAIYENIGGTFIYTKVHDAYMNIIDSMYLLKDDTAYIEIAKSSGLPLVKEKNPMLTSTYGVGDEIKDAIKRNAKRIVIACGGSSTNDGGCSAMSSFGCKFYDKNNNIFIPTGGTLKDIERIDTSELDKYKDIEFILMTDCLNPMYGTNGAAYVYSKQKGANDDEIKLLDEGLIHLSKVLPKDISNIKGVGAAGAFPACFMALLNSRIEQGINVILDSMNYEELIKDVDYIFTGEGKFDIQSTYGKVVSGIINRSKNKKIILICGIIDKSINLNGIYKMYQTSNNEPYDYIIKHSKEMYYNKVIDILKELK